VVTLLTAAWGLTFQTLQLSNYTFFFCHAGEREHESMVPVNNS
jgi:hypothetical protein